MVRDELKKVIHDYATEHSTHLLYEQEGGEGTTSDGEGRRHKAIEERDTTQLGVEDEKQKKELYQEGEIQIGGIKGEIRGGKHKRKERRCVNANSGSNT